jgi:hypothetical protein
MATVATTHERKTQGGRGMGWPVFAVGAALSWGFYGALLYMGQVQLGNPLKALLCVGVAYFLIGVLFPVVGLTSQSALGGFSAGGSTTADSSVARKADGSPFLHGGGLKRPGAEEKVNEIAFVRL